MNSTSLALVIGAFVVGCGGEPPARCPPVSVSSATSAATRPATPRGEAPFHSVVSLPDHRVNEWVVLVVVEGADAGHADQERSYVGKLASDLTAGTADVTGTRWRCRFDHVNVDSTVAGLLIRGIACSSDDWQTYVSDAASNAEPVHANRTHLFLNNAGKAIEVDLWPCTKDDPCPAASDMTDGRVSLSHGLSVHMVLLTGDPPDTRAR